MACLRYFHKKSFAGEVVLVNEILSNGFEMCTGGGGMYLLVIWVRSEITL